MPPAPRVWSVNHCPVLFFCIFSALWRLNDKNSPTAKGEYEGDNYRKIQKQIRSKQSASQSPCAVDALFLRGCLILQLTLQSLTFSLLLRWWLRTPLLPCLPPRCWDNLWSRLFKETWAPRGQQQAGLIRLPFSAPRHFQRAPVLGAPGQGRQAGQQAECHGGVCGGF